MNLGKQEPIRGWFTFEDPLTVQEVPGDNHRVEVLGEAWCAWRFDGLAQLTLLGELEEEEEKECVVKQKLIDCDHSSLWLMTLYKLWLHSVTGFGPGGGWGRGSLELP